MGANKGFTIVVSLESSNPPLKHFRQTHTEQDNQHSGMSEYVTLNFVSKTCKIFRKRG